MNYKLVMKLAKEQGNSELMKYAGYKSSRIKSSGKFEGESIAVLYFYDAFLNGFGTVFEVTAEEKQAFDITSNYVYLAESNDGFVSLEFYDTEEQAQNAERMDLDDLMEDF